MKQIRLLGIAPYEELNHSMFITAKDFEEIAIDIYTADLSEGQQLAQSLAHKDYDAIISRGGTASMIQEVASIPVFDVSISIYDILSAIKLANNYTQHIAIVAYSSITKTAHLICDVLQYNIKIITLESPEQADLVLDDLKREHFDLVLCDAITNQTALKKSMNTLLITSGVESITNAYQQAITFVKYLNTIKKDNYLLHQIIQNQSQQVLILSQQGDVIISNVEASLQKSIKLLLSKKNLEKQNQFYHTHKGQTYQIKVHSFYTDNNSYWHCDIKVNTPPITGKRFGVHFISQKEAEEAISKKLLSTSFIQEKNRELTKNLLKHYNTMLIFGESGTAKTSLAYSAFLQMKQHKQNLISIDCHQLNERLWKYLSNNNNGLLLEADNTLLLTHIDKLNIPICQQLIQFIKDSNFLRHNNLLMTYNTKIKGDPFGIFEHIVSELNCASLYSPSLAERHNEFTSIITLFLNKIKIECNSQVIGLEPEALERLQNFHWSENLSQLERVITKLVLSTQSYYISEHQVSELLQEERRHINSLTMIQSEIPIIPHLIEEKTLFDYSRDIILATLEQNKGNQTKTAKQLGISRTTLWRYIKYN
ncbi:sigma-54-dependent Fis family transcriptional regulator [Streptococcus marmotae]|uniref:sigma-54-dependent Fis family transcriptional regulator n=1 Tax=Streptococcus marmotae TaxID=1825069 RepID=UPI0008365A26|nr:sigma-54-dependent transcriptional regulator [Streptococcus marmotae]